MDTCISFNLQRIMFDYHIRSICSKNTFSDSRAIKRIQQVWRWGLRRNNDLVLNPDLNPYEALTEQDKQYNRDTSIAALKLLGMCLNLVVLDQSNDFKNVTFQVTSA
ncbi:Ryanodine receptor Ryr [Plasmopara halstedii]|uniref:Ryanodine receptor Ryr n=1 Tax=Plasmopara halstedii TaxID=4781 RepID=A0A0P1AN41_PLAHL|nr:Ryanodine receptor Ryr [Plasmopara halstedii]CEG42893.1 Ryanodine receptor Ryr [Plasmopara halstedii]|eukprot:XP_024579262.1 Ryanodine receptor Ryr [Plasmopara halstedii]